MKLINWLFGVYRGNGFFRAFFMLFIGLHAAVFLTVYGYWLLKVVGRWLA